MKALLIAWREIRWEVFLDRGSLLRTSVFVVVPILLVLGNRGVGRGVAGDLAILAIALQCVFFPSLGGIALIASTFVAEKENGTILPLLAAPIRDSDIVLGKLLGMVVPVMVANSITLAVGFGVMAYRYGAARVSEVLTPTLLFALLTLSFLFVITTGSITMIVAARVRSSRAAQQVAGIIIALSVALFGGLGFVASQVGEGWPLVGLGAALVLFDVVALELARRAWQRGEVLGRV